MAFALSLVGYMRLPVSVLSVEGRVLVTVVRPIATCPEASELFSDDVPAFRDRVRKTGVTKLMPKLITADIPPLPFIFGV
jgi:hypothetical protein